MEITMERTNHAAGNAGSSQRIKPRFDEEYVEMLRQGSQAVCTHFTLYFSALLTGILRRTLRRRDMVEDVRQETMLRVLQLIHRGAFRQPERLEALVVAVSRYVTYEMLRAESRYCLPAEEAPERADPAPNPESKAIESECRERLTELLADMGERDSRVLKMMFVDDENRAEICERVRVTPSYLRVVLFRARRRCKQKFSRSRGAKRSSPSASCQTWAMPVE
jgi:RNA polymerase sigma-70 factor (ECF subfamily)